MNARLLSSFARIVALVASVVMVTSRATLLLHEFVGHGAVAMLFGGRVTGFYLFLFAGGRVSYETPPLTVGPRLCITLGGIALELAIGAAAFVVARRLRRLPVATFCLDCVGTVLVGHGALYLARGVHYGYGDGALLGRVLGGARVVIVLAAGALLVATALYAGRRLATIPGSLLLGSRRRIVVLTLFAFASAGLVHGALAWTELRWFPDPRWVAIMEDASVVSARAELARRIAEAKRRGDVVPTPAEQARTLDALERARRPWPLDPVLAVVVAGGLIAGLSRGVRRLEPASEEDAIGRTPRWRTIGALAGALTGLVGLILLIRQFG